MKYIAKAAEWFVALVRLSGISLIVAGFGLVAITLGRDELKEVSDFFKEMTDKAKQRRAADAADQQEEKGKP